jgi:hypothetical protein
VKELKNIEIQVKVLAEKKKRKRKKHTAVIYFGFDDVRHGNIVAENRLSPRGVGVRFQRTEADVDIVRAVLHRRGFSICVSAP